MRWRRLPVAFEEGLAVACMALLVAITLLNVVTRYLTAQSFAWTEEISVFLMIVMTLAGGAAAAARDRHIRIEAFYDGGTAARRRRLRIFAACVTGLLFSALALLFARMVADEFRWGETTMGLGVPRWWYTLIVPVLCALLAARAFGVGWAMARGDAPAAEGAQAPQDAHDGDSADERR